MTEDFKWRNIAKSGHSGSVLSFQLYFNIAVVELHHNTHLSLSLIIFAQLRTQMASSDICLWLYTFSVSLIITQQVVKFRYASSAWQLSTENIQFLSFNSETKHLKFNFKNTSYPCGGFSVYKFCEFTIILSKGMAHSGELCKRQ